MENNQNKKLMDYIGKTIKNSNIKVNNLYKAERLLANIHHNHLFDYGKGLINPKTGKFKTDVTIDWLFSIYSFDSELRNALFSIIELIEVNLRSRLSYYLTMQYGPKGMFKKSNFDDIKRTNSTTNEVISTYETIIEHYKRLKPGNSKNGQPVEREFYRIIEQLSFGDIISLYNILKIDDKKYISSIYKMKFSKFNSNLQVIKEVRNICAHFEKIYDKSLRFIPSLKEEYKDFFNNNKVFAALLSMKCVIDNNRIWSKFMIRIVKVIKTYKKYIDLEAIGFPKNWEEILTK
ncbi:MAG: Abi family protein [Mycoplasmoidaceae bacterium]